MPWISNDKHKTEEKSTKSSRSSSKVVGLGLADLWELPTLIGVYKNNWGTQFKTVFQTCEGIWCSSVFVKEFDVIGHKNYITLLIFAILYPTSLGNLVFEVWTRHSHPILLRRYDDYATSL